MPVKLFFRKNAYLKAAGLRRCMEVLLHYSRKEKANLELSLVGATRIRTLNREYRHKDVVTDVLSFPIEFKAPKRGRPWQLGEIVIALPIARRQALQARRPLDRQVLRLAVHGFVHLHGLDHERSSVEQKRFEAMEKKYLRYLSKKGLMPWDGLLRF